MKGHRVAQTFLKVVSCETWYVKLGKTGLQWQLWPQGTAWLSAAYACREQLWADKDYNKANLGSEWKKPFAGTPHNTACFLARRVI